MSTPVHVRLTIARAQLAELTRRLRSVEDGLAACLQWLQDTSNEVASDDVDATPADIGN
jgi:hypothetical protein